MSPRSRKWIIGVILALVLGFFALQIKNLTDAAVESEQARQANAAVANENAEGLKQAKAAIAEANRRLERAGEPQVPVPDLEPPETVPVPGEVGPRGPGPSASEVRQAVASYCAETDCTGPRGEPGAGVTAAQVAAAVSTYCNDRGECRGPRGEAVQGPQGEPGETVIGPRGETGAQGPPPSAEQVAQAVADYCSTRDNCRGPRGETGAPGQDGARGPAGPPVTISSSCEDQDRPVESITVAGSPASGFTITCTRGDYPVPLPPSPAQETP